MLRRSSPARPVVGMSSGGASSAAAARALASANLGACTSTLAPLSRSRYSTSGFAKRQLIGTSTQPARMQPKNTGNSSSLFLPR